MVHSEELEEAERVLRMTGCLEEVSSQRVISTNPFSFPCFTKSFSCMERGGEQGEEGGGEGGGEEEGKRER